jgi:hypothetical protein
MKGFVWIRPRENIDRNPPLLSRVAPAEFVVVLVVVGHGITTELRRALIN